MISCSRCNKSFVPKDDSAICPHCGEATIITSKASHTAAEDPGNAPTKTKIQPGSPNELLSMLSPARSPDELGWLGPYRILQILGAGGMGVVFRAEDSQLQRQVALKTLLPSLAADATASKRFLREAQTVAAIKHPHIVTIHQVGEDRGIPYLAMEFLEGESLEDRLLHSPSTAPRTLAGPNSDTIAGARSQDQSGNDNDVPDQGSPLPMAEVLRIGREIAEGLAAAHERGLIHRDIKPHNIWLEKAAPGIGSALRPPTAKILDFGLARKQKDHARLTQSGDIVGTLAYMAPEQIAGGTVDHRSDLFSLGCTLYRMCTGQMSPALVLERPKYPSDLNPEVPSALADLVMQLLARSPEDRPQSAREVAERLVAMEQSWSPGFSRSSDKPAKAGTPTLSPLAPNSPPPRYRARSRAPKKLVPVLILLGLLILLVLGTVAILPRDSKTDVEGKKEPTKIAVENKKPSKVVDTPPEKDPKKDIVSVVPKKDPETKKPLDEPKKPPTPVGDSYVLQKILEYIRSEKDSERLRFLRFFSSHHLAAEGATPEEIKQDREALQRVIKFLSPKGKPAELKSLGEPDTIHAIDIRDLGWDKQPLTQGDDEKPATLSLFDLILLEYPYGVAPRSSEVFDSVAKEFMVPSGQIRPIVFVRSDWFVHAVRLPPLKGDLQLPVEKPEDDPLLGLSFRYQSPVGLERGAAELGVTSDELRQACGRGPVDVAPLGTRGAIPREAWERSFDRLVTTLGLGTPLAPLDSLTRRACQLGQPMDVEVTTDQPDNVFKLGDKVTIIVANKSSKAVFVELVSCGVAGNRDLIEEKHFKIEPGKKWEKVIPEVEGLLGKEQIVLFASETEFPLGEALKGKSLKKGRTPVSDRVVHRFFDLQMRDDWPAIIKKTIDTETKAK